MIREENDNRPLVVTDRRGERAVITPDAGSGLLEGATLEGARYEPIMMVIGHDLETNQFYQWLLKPDEKVVARDVVLYKGTPVEVNVLDEIVGPQKSSIALMKDRAFIRLCRTQIEDAARETGVSSRLLEGAVVHHEFGHLESHLRGEHFGNILDVERAAWQYARGEVPSNLPSSWGGIPHHAVLAAELWGLGSYDRGFIPNFRSGRRIFSMG